MPLRIPMPEKSVFHIYNKSIAGYTIFNTPKDYERFVWMMRYFLISHRALTFSNFLRYHGNSAYAKIRELSKKNPSLDLKIVSYCIMPTHFHLVLYQETPSAISTFMHNIQSSYAQFFNLQHLRKGPLWESRFKHVCCESDDQLVHLTRYVHLNPVTAYLVEKPEDWSASSYLEFTSEKTERLCEFEPFIDMRPNNYADFVCDRINDQRMLAAIKGILLEEEPISLPGCTSRK